MQVAAISELFDRHKIKRKDFSPVVLVQLLSFVSRSLITQRKLGVWEDHAEIVNFIDQTIADIDGSIQQAKRSTNASPGADRRLPARRRTAKR